MSDLTNEISTQNDIKPRSIRMDESTMDQFREIVKGLGGNQQTAMGKLVSTYEMMQAHFAFSDKKEELEKFESHMNYISKMFLSSIEDNKLISDTIRGEFDTLLKSKDSIVQDLQIRIEKINKTKDQALDRAKALDDENSQMRKKIHNLEGELREKQQDYASKLADKDKLNQTLTDSCAQLRGQNQEMEADVRSTKKIAAEREQLEKENRHLAQENDKLEDELQRGRRYAEEREEQIRRESQVEQQQLKIDLIQGHQEEMEALKLKKQNEIDEYQSKYLQLLERIEIMQKEHEVIIQSE